MLTHIFGKVEAFGIEVLPRRNQAAERVSTGKISAVAGTGFYFFVVASTAFFHMCSKKGKRWF